MIPPVNSTANLPNQATFQVNPFGEEQNAPPEPYDVWQDIRNEFKEFALEILLPALLVGGVLLFPTIGAAFLFSGIALISNPAVLPIIIGLKALIVAQGFFIVGTACIGGVVLWYSLNSGQQPPKLTDN